MIRINLLSVHEDETAFSRRRELVVVGVVLALLLAAMFFTQNSLARRLADIDSVVKREEQQLVKIREENQQLEKMEQQRKDLEEKSTVVRRLTHLERRAAPVHILDDLSSSAPRNLWLTEFVESDGNAKIVGKSVDNQTIATFARNLANSQYFRKLEIRETVQESTAAANPRQRRARRQGESDVEPSVSLTRFLIETNVRYLPQTEESEKTALIGKEASQYVGVRLAQQRNRKKG